MHKYKFTKDSWLIINACCSRQCPFYLKFTESLDLHISKATMPAMHKTIALKFNKTSEELFDLIIKFDCVMKDRTVIFSQYDEIIDEMKKNKSKYLKYIENLKESYKFL